MISSDPAWPGGVEGHRQNQPVAAQVAVRNREAALEERGAGGLSGGTSSDVVCSQSGQPELLEEVQDEAQSVIMFM